MTDLELIQRNIIDQQRREIEISDKMIVLLKETVVIKDQIIKAKDDGINALKQIIAIHETDNDRFWRV